MAQRKLSNEFKKVQASTEGISAELVGGDLFHWKAHVKGPEGTPYEGGDFIIDMKFPFDYPLKPPQCNFETKIYHPNVGSHGEICLDILSKSWTPIENATKVLLSLYYLLSTPDPDDSLSAEIAAQYKDDRAAFTQKAKEWTETYAKPQ